jgi:type IV secretory pathway VirB2 component (pilin)
MMTKISTIAKMYSRVVYVLFALYALLVVVEPLMAQTAELDELWDKVVGILRGVIGKSVVAMCFFGAFILFTFGKVEMCVFAIIGGALIAASPWIISWLFQ